MYSQRVQRLAARRRRKCGKSCSTPTQVSGLSGLAATAGGYTHEIILLTLEGCTAPDIASSLFISRRTVETHLANAYRKMGIGSKVELLRGHSEVTGIHTSLAGPSDASTPALSY